MTHFSHLCLTIFRRFWKTALAFVAVSFTASTWAARSPDSFPDILMTLLEAAAWLWLTVRILLSESAFRTQGGWRARPVTEGTMRAARWSCYLAALLPALMGRGIADAISLRFGPGEWMAIRAGGWLGLLGWLLTAAGLVAAAGSFRRRGGKSRGLLGACVCVMVAGALLFPGLLLRGMSQLRQSGSSGGFASTPEGLAAWIPPGDRIIDIYGVGGHHPPKSALRLLVKLPAEVGAEANAEGARVRVEELQAAGERLKFQLKAHGEAKALGSWKREETVVVARYSDGTWGWPRQTREKAVRFALPGFSLMRREEGGQLLSPKVYPWTRQSWEELLKGAELYVFVRNPDEHLPPTPAKPEESSTIGEAEMTIALPELPDNPSAAQISALARAAVNQMELNAWSDNSTKAAILLAKAGGAAVPFVLECAPFGRRAWTDHLFSFLRKSAREEDRSILLKLLETDPLMGDVLVAKGWQAEALPLLRRYLENGLLPDGSYMGSPSALALAALKDPALAGPFFRLAVLSNDDQLVQALRDYPGLDWNAMVLQGCRQSAFQSGETSGIWLDLAAGLGDRETFHDRVAAWLRAPAYTRKTEIHGWIEKATWDGEITDFPAWIRGNFDRLQWDGSIKRWVLPGSR